MDFNSFNDEFIKLPEILTDPLQLFLAELNILFNVERGSILGKRTFGNSLEQLLWKTTYNETFIKHDIEENIMKFCSMNEFFDWEVDFSVAKGVSRDIGQLTINIRNKSESTLLANPSWIFK